MAEAILNSLYHETYLSFSGGTEPKAINENTIKVLKEIGIDISNEKSKSIEVFKNMKFNHVITVCEDDNCPYFPDADNYINKSFKDPENSPKSEHLDSFRKVRDEIKNWINEIVENGVI
jgi:arsenate reductase